MRKASPPHLASEKTTGKSRGQWQRENTTGPDPDAPIDPHDSFGCCEGLFLFHDFS